MIKAVIFDCDGVLVESEVIAHEVELAALAEIGMHYDPHDFAIRFMGMSDKAFWEALDADGRARLGRPIMEEIREPMLARYREAIATRLTEVDGALSAIRALRLPKAVGSSSTVRGLEVKLKKVGHWEHFAPHVYSAEHVTHAKPAPDLFLHAAKMLDMKPQDCLVIEDTVNGVTAGRAAGMTVWGFRGGGHMSDRIAARLTEAGAERVVRNWAEAEALFAAL
jgi:HAD superfamily hydrolase (TIGR01509 family)